MATSKDKGDKAKSSLKKADKPASESSEVLGDKVRGGEALGFLMSRGSLLGAAGLGLSVVLGMLENDSFRRFSFAYLTAFMWLLSIVLGGLFWVTLQHLVNAKWSVSLRRLGELVAVTAPVLGVLALPIVVPILLGNDTLYVWANHATVEADHLLHHKAPYLNPGFFLVRFLFYFGFWTLISRFFLKESLKQDQTGAANALPRMQRASAPAMFLFALTITFCAVDLLMSLEPYWFSTIFGVYYFASCVLAIHSALVLAAMWLQGRGLLKRSVTVEHFHDLGKMMFAFTVFWAYIGFSQFMLIWYANIPEETAWFKERFAGDWGDVSILLLVAHFVIPFFGMLSRQAKRNRKVLAFWAYWTLAVIYLDMYWLIMPAMKTEEVPLSLMDLTCVIGMAGVLVASVAFFGKNVNLVPVKDPRLSRSVAFENI
jgi:hypothetical protein